MIDATALCIIILLRVQVFGTLYLNEGLDKQLAVDRAVKIFSSLDINGDGDITEVSKQSITIHR